MEAGRRWYRLGVVGSLAALVVLAVALVPGASAQKGGFKSCGNKKLTIQIDDGEGHKTPYKIEVKTVSAKGVSCAKAFEFIRLQYNGEKVGKHGYPLDYNCKGGEFTVPTGWYPEICSKPGKTIKYGAQGG